MISGSSYRMSNVSFDYETWDDVPDNACINLQSGATYGMLWIRHECLCCNSCTFYDYFFENKNDDVVLKWLRLLHTSRGSLYLTMPDGLLGNFKLSPNTCCTIDDAYVLRNAANVYYSQYNRSCHWSLELLFTNIHKTVRLRASFRRLSNYRQRVITELHRSTVLEMLWKKGITESVLCMRIIRLSELW